MIDNIKDTISDGSGLDTVQSTLSVDLRLPAFAAIENVQLLGTGAISAIGRDDANRLEGNTGANKLTGNDGGDTLIGNAGNDTLDGGAGADSMQGGDGSDTYIAGRGRHDRRDDRLAAGGIDLVQSSVYFTLRTRTVEKLTLIGHLRESERHRQRAGQHASPATTATTSSTARAAPTPWPAASATTPTSSITPRTW